MTTDRQTPPPNVSNRQRIIAIVFIIILLVIIWQIWGLFSGGADDTPPPAVPVAPAAPGSPTPTPGSPIPSGPQQMVPQPANVPRPQMPLSQHESDMMRLQQQSEAKYVATLNELQMLRLERDIAETNKAIMAAKLDTVTSEKSIVDLLQPPPPVPQTAYARGLVNPVSSGTAPMTAPVTQQPTTITPVTPPIQTVQPATTTPAATTTTTTTTVTQPQPETPYSVLSVTQVQRRWSAVIGFQGSLYSVFIGDILPPDGSKVLSIDRSGVMLEKNNVRRKVSMVPII